MIRFREEIDGIEFTLEFTTTHNKKYYAGIGKSWPETTQCIIKKNGEIISVGTAVRHNNDSNKPEYGRTYAAKKAFAGTRLWKDFNQFNPRL